MEVAFHKTRPPHQNPVSGKLPCRQRAGSPETPTAVSHPASPGANCEWLEAWRFGGYPRARALRNSVIGLEHLFLAFAEGKAINNHPASLCGDFAACMGCWGGCWVGLGIFFFFFSFAAVRLVIFLAAESGRLICRKCNLS